MKRNLMILALALVMAAPAALAQMTTVKGTVKDRDGKPMAGVQVQFVGLDNGRKLQLKTDKKGEYYSLGVQAGKYNINFFNPDGSKLYSLNGVQVRSDQDANTFDVDMAKEAAAAQQQI